MLICLRFIYYVIEMASNRGTRNWILVTLYVAVSLMTQAFTVAPGVVSANPDVPLPNVMIMASGGGGYGFNVTNALGKYILTQGLTAGTYNVTAMAEGYIMQELGGIKVVVGSETGSVNFSLRRSGGISGKVTSSATGKGVANVIITAYTEHSYGWFAMTDADGNYKIITNLAMGTYNVTASLPTGFFGKTVSGVKVTAGAETKNVNLILDPSGIITGKVTTKTGGKPLEGVTVMAMSSDDKGYTGYAATEADGTYKIETGLGTGVYIVLAQQGLNMNQVQDVAVTAGKETLNVNLTLDVTPPVPSGTIKGRVTDTSNNPIVDASVSAGDGDATTDENGYYEITSGLPTGTYTVYVDAHGYEPASKDNVSVTAGSATLNVNFKLEKIPATKSGRISGTVTGEENPLASKQASTITCSTTTASVKLGESVAVSGAVTPAVSGATVTLLYKLGSTEVTRQATTGADGKYSDSYSPSATGSWTVTASWAGNTQYSGAASQAATFTVSQAAPTTGGLKVTVKDSTGKALVGAAVSSTTTPSGQSALSGVTTSDGSVTFASVAPGSYTVQASMSGYVTNTGTSSVTAGGTASVSITLQTQTTGGGGTSGGGIPGYPVEALMMGIVIGAAFLMLLRKRSSSTPPVF